MIINELFMPELVDPILGKYNQLQLEFYNKI